MPVDNAETIHEYAACLVWEGNLGKGTADYTAYSRRFRVLVQNKPDIAGTADAAFRGEPDKHNPEELLMISVASCHMLFYLSLCARKGLTVLEYKDEAHCKMKVFRDGGGRIEEVTLNPHVTIARESDEAMARELHAKANELCFIANSCKFPIIHCPVISVFAHAAEAAQKGGTC